MKRTEFELKSNVDAALRKMDSEAKERLEAAAIEVHGETQKKFSSPKSGEWYRKPGSSSMYQASDTGEAPARPTGRLATDVRWRGPRHLGAMKAQVGTTLEYGAKLETGIYPAGPKSEARRPWLRPSFRDTDVKKILGGKRWRL